jgi:Xaa-Pro dipeptidase
MFKPNIYQNRRIKLSEGLENGIILLPGNNHVPMNYPSNTLRFRQDSNFLYYCGLDYPELNLIIDVISGESILFGDNLSVQDIVWEGSRTSLELMIELSGISKIKSNSELKNYLSTVNGIIHTLPTYRADQKLFLNSTLNGTNKGSSKNLIQNVIQQRSIKSKEEISEIESALSITAKMHELAMKLTHDGISEQYVVGQIEGYALSNGSRLAYPIIFTINGEILHSNNYDNIMTSGKLALNDSGAESSLHYASDITRTFPVNGKFSSLQKEIYNIVFMMQRAAFTYCSPGKSYKEAHIKSAKIAVEGLSSLGIMKGNSSDAVEAGAHALFFPHGLGHMLGLDVHDMEGLGEDLVGYDNNSERSDQFGLAYLRLAKNLEVGFVLTVEPGIYFIPSLIDQWETENKHHDFINYDALNYFKDFGGIRIEDNIVIIEDGYRILGPPIPSTIDDIEDIMA